MPNSELEELYTRQLKLPLSVHIEMCSRINPQFKMFPFFEIHTESISAKLAKEQYFMIPMFKTN